MESVYGFRKSFAEDLIGLNDNMRHSLSRDGETDKNVVGESESDRCYNCIYDCLYILTLGNILKANFIFTHYTISDQLFSGQFNFFFSIVFFIFTIIANFF